MLDPKVTDLVDRMVRDQFDDRREQLRLEITEVQNEASNRGSARSGSAIKKICDLCAHDIKVRTVIVWQTLLKVLSQTGIVPSEGLAQELKSLVAGYESAITVVALQHSDQAVAGTTINSRESLEAALNKAMTKVYTEIDFFILSLVRSNEARETERGSPQPIFNFYSAVGAVQTGSSATANVAINIGPEDREALFRALDLVKSALAGVQSLPANPPAEIIELVDEVKSEIEKPKPNGTRLGSLALTIATAIQTVGSLQPAYQTLKAALLSLGVMLP